MRKVTWRECLKLNKMVCFLIIILIVVAVSVRPYNTGFFLVMTGTAIIAAILFIMGKRDMRVCSCGEVLYNVSSIGVCRNCGKKVG